MSPSRSYGEVVGVAGRIEAAGGVLWRDADNRHGVEIALVHRPGHDGWSLPKGKLLAGEPPVLGAVREVAEETGFSAAVGPRLGSTRYPKDGATKRVHYWAMRAGSGGFEPGREIDDLRWLAPGGAVRRVRSRDLPIIGAFADSGAQHTWPLLLVRPGSAVSGGRRGVDRDRALDRRGRRQAAALAALLDVYAVRRLVAADLRRCEETLEPLAGQRGPAVERGPVDPAALAGAGVPTVVCARRRELVRLYDGLPVAPGTRRRAIAAMPKGGFHVLHLWDPGVPRSARPEPVLTSA